MNVTTRRVLPWKLIDRLATYKQVILLVFGLIIFTAALVACWHLVSEISFRDLTAAVRHIPQFALLLAGLAVLASYIMLIGYEWSAAHYAGVKLPLRTLITGGICASAVGNAIGISILSGGAVRCRLYFKKGLSAIDVARMSIFVSLSLGSLLPLIAAIAALVNLPDAQLALRISHTAIITLALLVIGGYLLLFVYLMSHAQETRPSAYSRMFAFGRWSLRLPNLKLSILQFVITLLDVFFACSIIYFLLPQQPDFVSFLMVYIIALVVGVLSHVPGGVGVFEVIMLSAFSAQIGVAQLAAALLIYRLIYLLVPLIIAGVILLINEIKGYLSSSFVFTSGASIAAPVMSILIFFTGIFILFISVLPRMNKAQSEWLDIFVPHQLINISHLVVSLIGVLCLLLARGLRRRIASACWITCGLLVSCAILSLLRGWHWGDGLVLLSIAGLLFCFRSAFYRKAQLTLVPFSPLFIGLCFGVIILFIWLLLFVYQDIPYYSQTWPYSTAHHYIPKMLRAGLGCLILLVCLSLIWLLRPVLPLVPLPDQAQLAKARQIMLSSKQPEGGLVMSGDKSILFNKDETAFLMYARRRRSMVALFDPIGDPKARAELIWAFRDLCDQHYLRPVFYQVSATDLPNYMDIGLTALKLGEEALVDLTQFDLAAKENKDLRYTWSRGQRDGLSLAIYPAGQAPFEQLKLVSDEWLKNKQAKEKGFSLGAFSCQYLTNFAIATIEYQGRIIAFTNLLDTEQYDNAGIDIMRVMGDVPKLTMEYLMLALILHYKEQNYRYFSLGMVPLSGLNKRRGAPITQRLGALVFRRGERFYNFQGLRRFKEKFATHWRPRYLAVPAGLDPVVALVDTTMLISGGVKGLVKTESENK